MKIKTDHLTGKHLMLDCSGGCDFDTAQIEACQLSLEFQVDVTFEFNQKIFQVSFKELLFHCVLGSEDTDAS